ncbi:MAG TPA: glycosyltransferase [Bryobacteraceae bacterium]|nr:glycosyltransferase [Bryobacteraceae bacterium]
MPEDDRAYELWLMVENKPVQVFTGLARPDVARHHQNNPRFKNSGFLVRFNHRGSDESVRLIARTGDAEVVLADDIVVPVVTEAIPMPPSGASSSYRPLISILLGVPDAHPYLVTRSIESVRQQYYPYWELCIACESGEPGPSRQYLEKTAREDVRVKLLNAGIDRALETAEGEFVVFFDYRDELHPAALAEIAGSLNEDERVDLIYPDEDEMDFYGHRGQPFRKPDFDPEAFLSWNFIGNGAAVRRSVLLQAGGYSTDAWDVMFRIIEATESSRVRHLPKALYHDRKGDDLVAPLPREVKHSSLAIQNHLARAGMSAAIEAGLFPGSFRLRREKAPACQIAVVVRSEDGAFQHAALAATINPRSTRIYELLGAGAELLADNRLPGAEQVVPRPIRNLSEVPADVFIFLNRPLDTVSHFFFDELAAQALREDCGLVTGIGLNRDGRILHSNIQFSQGELPRNFGVVRSVKEITDEFFAVKRSQIITQGVVSSTHMRQVVKRLAELAHAANMRVLVTPYAVATFDIADECDHLSTEEAVPPESNFDELNAALAERKLAAAQLREISSERNRLRRELAAIEKSLVRLETSQCQELRQQIEELNAALEVERQIIAGIRNSLSWKLTAPLRACMGLVRGK